MRDTARGRESQWAVYDDQIDELIKEGGLSRVFEGFEESKSGERIGDLESSEDDEEQKGLNVKAASEVLKWVKEKPTSESPITVSS